MEATTQVDPNELICQWIIKAMQSADVNVAELSRRSGVRRETIDNIIHQKHKNGCRIDILLQLVSSCGFTFREFESVVKPL